MKLAIMHFTDRKGFNGNVAIELDSVYTLDEIIESEEEK